MIDNAIIQSFFDMNETTVSHWHGQPRKKQRRSFHIFPSFEWGQLKAGMGEPANNLEAVTTALGLLTDELTFGMSRRLITVSTVAPSPQHVLDLSDLPCKLAWSIHAGKDSVRRHLVPSARFAAAELRDAFQECIQKRPARYQQLLCEVVLLDGVNTEQEDAAALADLLLPFEREQIFINLIPYNDISGLLPNGPKMARTSAYRAPSIETVRQFQRHLWQRGLYCSIRQTRGDSKASACGQLAVMGAALLALKNRVTIPHWRWLEFKVRFLMCIKNEYDYELEVHPTDHCRCV